MKTAISIIIAFYFTNYIKSQDTIYTNSYPKGIVTKDIEETKFSFSFIPINNSQLNIKVADNSVSKIKYLNGKIYVNPDYNSFEQNEVILSTDPLTGKVVYTGIIEAKGASMKSLYNSIKTIPHGEVKYFLIASDETELTYQKYVGRFSVYFAGDPYIMFFNLLIKFKDGKIKYEYSDFVATFGETKSKGELNGLFSNGVHTTTSERQLIVDKLYAQPRKSDFKLFWKPIANNINNSISSLQKLCLDVSGSSKDW